MTRATYEPLQNHNRDEPTTLTDNSCFDRNGRATDEGGTSSILMNEQNTYDQPQTPTNPFIETRSNEGVTLANTGSAIGDGLERRVGYHSLLSPGQYERIQTTSDNAHQLETVEQAVDKAKVAIQERYIS